MVIFATVRDKRYIYNYYCPGHFFFIQIFVVFPSFLWTAFSQLFFHFPIGLYDYREVLEFASSMLGDLSELPSCCIEVWIVCLRDWFNIYPENHSYQWSSEQLVFRIDFHLYTKWASLKGSKGISGILWSRFLADFIEKYLYFIYERSHWQLPNNKFMW